jgi:hypothetical protein
MESFGVFIAIILPAVLAFGLIIVSRPPWMGWVMWAVSVIFAVLVWRWALGHSKTGGEYFGYAFAALTSASPLAALVIRLLGKGKQKT